MAASAKQLSHGRIGEAAVYAKCWMHGIQAYFTGVLKHNFPGSDLLVATDRLQKRWIEVKTGYSVQKDGVYLTQSSGEDDLKKHKFTADFVVFVNLDPESAKKHTHNGELDFSDLAYYVVPRDEANRIFREALQRDADRPKKDGTKRSLKNVAVHASLKEIERFRDAWNLLKQSAE
jgi:hypothetical protein